MKMALAGGARRVAFWLPLLVWAGAFFGAASAAETPNAPQTATAPPGLPVATLEGAGVFKGHSHVIFGSCFSPDGLLLATASQDQTIRIWDVAKRQLLRQLAGHEAGVRAVAFSPDGKQLLSGSWDATARVWDVASGQELRVLKGHIWPVLGVAWSPDGKRALTCSDGFRLWNMETGELLRHYTGHGQKTVWSVQFSGDGKRALTGSADETARIWDLDSGAEIRKFGEHNGRVLCARYAPGDQTVATCCVEDDAVRIWDAASGQELKRLHTREPGIATLAFSPDGKRLLAGEGSLTPDGSLDYQYPKSALYLWDLHTDQLLAQSPNLPNYVAWVAVAPDGTTAVSSSYERTLRCWKLPPAAP